ncbi:protein FAM3B [Bufo gargarizans]|uniref:protein FAM3B n=1 Tax=Bufo gargarizans TaxID=30331 RepID=UPI001CF3AFC2|nr:protein FAM3B [Bufo gargarizans]
MVNYRFLSANSVKVVGLICASLGAWYLGYVFAAILPEDSLQSAIGSMQKIVDKPVIKAPLPMKQKCAAWRTCPSSEVVYRLRSGGGKDILPDICLEDEILLGGIKKTGDRGINIAVVSWESMKVTDTKTFDMYDGDFSGPMVEFINKIASGSIILVVSHDDASSKLSEDAKKVFESLGSKEVRNLKFRSQWVFLTIKGGTVPENIEKEKIIHASDNNRYGSWPAEIQIVGCLPKKNTYTKI